MSDPAIRPMRPEDITGLVALLREMQAHYGVPCPAPETIRADLQALPPGTTMLIATAPEVIGFASLCALYPGPGLRRGLFLKELYVAEAARGTGIGRALMRACAGFAAATGHARIDWTADRRSPQLQRFYERTGAAAQPDKVFFRLAGEALAELASSDG